MKTLLRLLKYGVCWALAAPALASAQFTTGDLAGTWSVYVCFDDPAGHRPGETRGSVTLDTNGDFTGGTLSPLGGSPETVTGGSLTVTPAGIVSGTLTTNEGSNALSDLQFHPSGDILLGVDTDPDGVVSLLTVVRESGTFSEAGFAGSWNLSTPTGTSASILTSPAGPARRASSTRSGPSFKPSV